jgi:hypothetical protein
VRKRECRLAWEDMAAWSEGLLAVLLGDEAGERLTANLQRLKTTIGNRGYKALIRRFAARRAPAALGRGAGVPGGDGHAADRSGVLVAQALGYREQQHFTLIRTNPLVPPRLSVGQTV